MLMKIKKLIPSSLFCKKKKKISKASVSEVWKGSYGSAKSNPWTQTPKELYWIQSSSLPAALLQYSQFPLRICLGKGGRRMSWPGIFSGPSVLFLVKCLCVSSNSVWVGTAERRTLPAGLDFWTRRNCFKYTKKRICMMPHFYQLHNKNING